MSNSSFFTGSGITANQTSAIATSVSSAATSATSSASSATTASEKAAIATAKAIEAAASAAASEASKDASVAAKNAASSSASAASTQANNSANSSTSAGSQATASASSANTASGHASTATTKANEAAASAALANTKAGIATTAANSTSGSASAAASSAATANQAKLDALAAELEAENAEAVALNAASIATSKAQVASTAAITATNKANQVTTDNNTATTKAAEAAASATASAASATTSTASKDTAVAVTANFLGAHSSAPTATASGGALAVGMLYFDTGSDVLKVRASGGWINAGSSVNGTSARFAYTLTGGQDTVSGNDTSGNALAYDSGFADVYLNGVKLAAADFTATSGSSIVLAAVATAGDILEVVAFGTFQLSNGTFAGTTTVNNLTVTGTVDGQDVAAMGTKLAGIETSATADQTKSDIEGLGIDVPAANLTGTIAAARLSTATTQAESDDSTKIATTAYVVDKITTLIGGAPSTLNDLSELATAINNDANYNSTLTTALGTKMPKSGGAFTGAVTTNSTFDGVDIATRDAVLTATTTTANAALPKSGGAMTGALMVGVTSTTVGNGTVTFPNSGMVAFHDAGGNARNSLQFVSGELKHGAAGGGLTTQTFFTSATERMRIDSSGQIIAGPFGGAGNAVIAGSSSPSYTNQAGTNLLLKSGDGSGTGSSFMSFSTSPAGSSGTTVNTATERMRIDSSGNVGIGSGSLDSLMARTAQGYLSTRVNNFNITSGSSAYAFTGVNIYQDANGAYKYIDTGASSSIHYWGGDIQFHTATSGSADATQSSSTQKMVITSSGHVGIGGGSQVNNEVLRVNGAHVVGGGAAGIYTIGINQVFTASAAKYLRIQLNNSLFGALTITATGDYSSANAIGVFQKTYSIGANNSNTSLYSAGNVTTIDLGGTSGQFSMGSPSKPNATTLYVPIANLNGSYTITMSLVIEFRGSIRGISSVDIIAA